MYLLSQVIYNNHNMMSYCYVYNKNLEMIMKYSIYSAYKISLINKLVNIRRNIYLEAILPKILGEIIKYILPCVCLYS